MAEWVWESIFRTAIALPVLVLVTLASALLTSVVGFARPSGLAFTVTRRLTLGLTACCAVSGTALVLILTLLLLGTGYEG